MSIPILLDKILHPVTAKLDEGNIYLTQAWQHLERDKDYLSNAQQTDFENVYHELVARREQLTAATAPIKRARQFSDDTQKFLDQVIGAVNAEKRILLASV